MVMDHDALPHGALRKRGRRPGRALRLPRPGQRLRGPHPARPLFGRTPQDLHPSAGHAKLSLHCLPSLAAQGSLPPIAQPARDRCLVSRGKRVLVSSLRAPVSPGRPAGVSAITPLFSPSLTFNPAFRAQGLRSDPAWGQPQDTPLPLGPLRDLPSDAPNIRSGLATSLYPGTKGKAGGKHPGGKPTSRSPRRNLSAALRNSPTNQE